jgi:regulator of replication initiation timing
LVAWFLTKRRQKAEIKKLKLGNAEQAIDINSKMLELLNQYQNDMVELRKEVKQLTETNERLQCEVRALKRMLNSKKTNNDGKA